MASQAHVARTNGAKGGRPPKENLLEGLTNLETGEPAVFIPRDFPSMKAAAAVLKVDIGILKEARSQGCNAFMGSGAINRERLIAWLESRANEAQEDFEQTAEGIEEDSFVDDYEVEEEAGGVGKTLKSLQAYERKLKRRLDEIEARPGHPITKGEMVEKAQAAWVKVLNALLKYDLNVNLAKRESGELIPLTDAQKGVEALLAWHTVALSDTLRNVIPECEMRSRYDIAKVLDPAMRSSIYRNFKLGAELGKIPDWMYKAAVEAVKAQPSVSEPKDTPVTTDVSDY